MIAVYKSENGEIICCVEDNHIFSDIELTNVAIGKWGICSIEKDREIDARKKRCNIISGILSENFPKEEWPENKFKEV